MYRHNDVPRWEDLDLDDIDYEARDGPPSGHERTLRALRSKIESTEAVLQRYLRELGVSFGGDLAKVSIPTHLQYRDPYAFERARRARSAQSTLESQRKRFCQVLADHCAEKARLREEAEGEDDDDTDDEEAVSE
jgi:hypothetical protein